MTAQSLIKAAVPGQGGKQLLDARYFDTTTLCLQKAKLAYRIRREGEQWIATIKDGGMSSGGLHERREWNVAVPDAQPDISVFEDTDIGKKLIELVGCQQLEPILSTKFERRTMDIMMPDNSLIEVAADQGIIVAASKKAPILEVELELKSGKPAALLQLGAQLAREYPFIPEPDSKFYRGLKLAGLAAVQPPKAAKLQIDKNQQADEGLCTILVGLIAQFLVIQQVFLAEPTQPEHVHELRISLRRLRSLLEFYEPFVEHAQYKYHQAELRKLGQLLGELREIDVANAAWLQCHDIQATPLEGKINLGGILAKHRLLEAEKVSRALNAGFATPLLLELWAMLIGNKDQQLIESHLTVGEYSVRRLSSWLKIVIKEGKSLDWTVIENVHKLRLQIKKIRYAAEVLEPVFYEISQLILRLDTLQIQLGLLCDAHSIDNLLRKYLKTKSSKVLYLEVGLVTGWQQRELLAVQGKMDKHWKKFYRAAQRWL